MRPRKEHSSHLLTGLFYFNENCPQITFTLTKEEINTWLTGTPFIFDEDIHESNERSDLKIRPRVIDENFRSRHIQFEIQNEWGIRDLNEFLDIMKKSTFGILKKWIRLHNGIRANFCVTATYERQGQREIIASEPMHLQTQNYIFLLETNLNEMYNNITNYIIGRHENISENLEGTQWVLVSIDSYRININRYDPVSHKFSISRAEYVTPGKHCNFAFCAVHISAFVLFL